MQLKQRHDCLVRNSGAGLRNCERSLGQDVRFSVTLDPKIQKVSLLEIKFGELPLANICPAAKQANNIGSGGMMLRFVSCAAEGDISNKQNPLGYGLIS